MSKLVFIDTETTSLRPDRRAWEVGLVERTAGSFESPGHKDIEHHWFVATSALDLGNADPFALKIGRFYERHPYFTDKPDKSSRFEASVLREVEHITRGAHLVGAVVSFDAEVLAARMRAHGICPSWHYHLIDVEALTVGYLSAMARVHGDLAEYATAEELRKAATLPWKSDELAAAVGVKLPSDDQRHTALGDARWARDIYDAVVGLA